MFCSFKSFLLIMSSLRDSLVIYDAMFFQLSPSKAASSVAPWDWKIKFNEIRLLAHESKTFFLLGLCDPLQPSSPWNDDMKVPDTTIIRSPTLLSLVSTLCSAEHSSSDTFYKADVKTQKKKKKKHIWERFIITTLYLTLLNHECIVS